eukprot:gene5692-biopygen17757
MQKLGESMGDPGFRENPTLRGEKTRGSQSIGTAQGAADGASSGRRRARPARAAVSSPRARRRRRGPARRAASSRRISERVRPAAFPPKGDRRPEPLRDRAFPHWRAGPEYVGHCSVLAELRTLGRVARSSSDAVVCVAPDNRGRAGGRPALELTAAAPAGVGTEQRRHEGRSKDGAPQCSAWGGGGLGGDPGGDHPPRERHTTHMLTRRRHAAVHANSGAATPNNTSILMKMGRPCRILKRTSPQFCLFPATHPFPCSRHQTRGFDLNGALETKLWGIVRASLRLAERMVYPATPWYPPGRLLQPSSALLSTRHSQRAVREIHIWTEKNMARPGFRPYIGHQTRIRITASVVTPAPQAPGSRLSGVLAQARGVLLWIGFWHKVLAKFRGLQTVSHGKSKKKWQVIFGKIAFRPCQRRRLARHQLPEI